MRMPSDSSCQGPAEESAGFSSLSRRNLLRLGAAGAAGVAASRFSFGQGKGSPYAGTPSPQPDFTPKVTSKPYALVDRITYGINSTEMALYDQLGWAGYLAYHLAPSKISDTYVSEALLEFPSINCTPYQGLKTYTNANGFNIMSDLGESQIVRQTFSQRQLLETVTEFWLDHFNIYAPNIWPEFLPQFVNMIRANALGSFTTLLNSVARSGAMLFYLNNVVNDRYNHNENYARELLELHTLGPYQGYQEADIYVCRRCLTGWNFEGFFSPPWQNTTDPNWGQFQYYPNQHDNEGGYFMGTLISKGDMIQGETILNMLATHPNTAKHICTKLIQRFVTETPTLSFVTAAANVFLKNAGSITDVLSFILSEANFTANATPKYKRPLNYAISVLRATNAYVSDPSDVMYSVLLPLGQLAFNWGPPNGYPDLYINWSDNLLPRWRYAVNLCTQTMWGAHMDPFPFMTDRSSTGVIAFIDKAFFGGSLPTVRATSLKTYLGSSYPSNEKILETMALALALPEFQWH